VPTGRSFAACAARTWAAIERLGREHQGRDIVSVGHGGNIRAALGLALGISPQAALGFFIENCSITRLDCLTPEDGVRLWRVAAVNQRPWSRAG
jgi:broad specificity phosphatase PhoE